MWKLDGSRWVNDGLYDLRSKQKVMEDTMADKRNGFKYVTELPGSEKFVSMIQLKGEVFVCTDRSMYKMVDERLVRMNIEIADEQHVVMKEDGFIFQQ